MWRIGPTQHNLTVILQTIVEKCESIERKMAVDTHDMVLIIVKHEADKIVQVRHEAWKNFHVHLSFLAALNNSIWRKPVVLGERLAYSAAYFVYIWNRNRLDMTCFLVTMKTDGAIFPEAETTTTGFRVLPVPAVFLAFLRPPWRVSEAPKTLTPLPNVVSGADSSTFHSVSPFFSTPGCLDCS